jgi:1D-myo-inositol-tetrakisphosphate 5-kinase/inositol-polyphosphate multikinase
MATDRKMIPLASQVGGHPGVHTSEDGSIVFKLVFAREMSFYQSLTSNPFSAALRSCIPKFFGILGSEGQIEDGAHPLPKQEKDKYFHLEVYREITRVLITTTRWIVLENLSHGFSKPNVIDIKLGTRFYDEETSEEKKERMIKSAKNSTALETGVRLTGFQVSDMQ